jgi:hypothetical protein
LEEKASSGTKVFQSRCSPKRFCLAEFFKRQDRPRQIIQLSLSVAFETDFRIIIPQSDNFIVFAFSCGEVGALGFMTCIHIRNILISHSIDE